MNVSERFSRYDVALLILLAGLVALFFWRILTPNPADLAQFPPGDFTDQFYAFRLYEARSFAEGGLPLWSENFNSGHPFLADIQSAVFYPIALANTIVNLALFRSFSLFALELEALLHFYLAGAFTYIFARRVLQRSARAWFRGGAFTSALVFTFGGYLTSYPSLQLAILETAAWLPLALYFLDRATDPPPSQLSRSGKEEFVSSPSPKGNEQFASSPSLEGEEEFASSTSLVGKGLGVRFLLAAGLVLGAAAMAGHAQTFLFVVVVCALYFGFRVSSTAPKIPNRRYGAAVGWFGLVLLIAFGVAAIQLIPAVEYQQLSTREALSFAEAAKGFPTLDVLQFILPGYASAFASPLYVGILPLWLALFALARRTTNDADEASPATRRPGNVREDSSRPTRISQVAFWGLVALGALILAFGFYVFAYVLFYLFVPGAALFRGQERLAFVVSFALAMLAGFGMCDLLNGLNLPRARRLYALLPAGTAVMFALLLTFFVAGAQNSEGRLSFLGDRAGLMLLQFALATVLVGLYLNNRLSTRLFAFFAIVLVLFDLWSVNEPANKGQVEERFANIPFTEILQNDSGIFRVAADEQLLPGHFGIVTGLEEIGGISPLRLARYDQLLHDAPSVVNALLNVRYRITRASEVSNADLLAREGTLELWKLRELQPRAWLVGNARVETNDAQTATMLNDGFDFTHSAILAAPAPFSPDERAAGGTVNLVSRQAGQYVLDVNTPADGLLVVGENYYPGWRASVDEQPVEILRADLTLRAIPVRAGQHRIVMWYDPLSFKLGALISAVTLIVCLGVLVYFSFRQARTRTPTG